MSEREIGVIVGSLRRDGYSHKLANALEALAPPSLRLARIGIGDLPLYDEDLETAAPPAAWTAFRNRVIASDAILFVSPEYNRSMTGALKNALDVGSRPWGASAWAGKPAAVISISPGAFGGMAANHHLRQVLYAVDLAAMAYPEAYLPAAATLFDADGRLKSAEARQLAEAFLRSFERWIGRVAES
jgi:chromate reductase